MKLMRPSTDAQPVQPAFDMLRASLRAAQAATPTALASNILDHPHRHVAALHGLLGELAGEDDNQSWRHGSFFTLNRLPDDKAL